MRIGPAREPRVAAVVSRGGRPDLAGRRLAAVHAPTLFIVGAEDHEVLAVNQRVLPGAVRCTLSHPMKVIILLIRVAWN